MEKRPQKRKALLSFVTVLAPVVLIALLCMLILFARMNRQMRGEIDAQQLETLARVELQADMWMDDLRKRIFALATDSRASLLCRAARPWSAGEIYTAYELIGQAWAVQTMSSVSCFPGYFIPDANAVLGGGNQYTPGQYWQTFFPDCFESAAQITELLTKKTGARFLPILAKNGEVLLYCSRFASTGAYECQAFALISMQKFALQLFPARAYGDAHIRIVDENTGMILYETGDFAFPAMENGSRIAHNGGMACFQVRSEALGWAYQMLLPESALYEHLSPVNRQIAAVSAVLLALGTLLAALMIRRAYQPIRHLMDLSLAQLDDVPSARSEWALIEGAFTRMAEHNLARDAALAHQREELRAFALQRALLGAGVESCGDLPQAACWLIAPCPVPEEQSAREIEPALRAAGIGAVSALLPGACCVMLQSENALCEAAQILLACLPGTHAVGISGRLNGPGELAQGYRQIQMLLRVLPEMPQGGMLAYGEMHEMLAHTLDQAFSRQLQKQFLSAAITGNHGEARRLIADFLSRLHEERAISLPLAQGVLMNLFGAQAEPGAEILEQISACASLAELREAVDKHFRALSGGEACDREDNHTMLRVKAYIDTHFSDPELSAAALAERFSISPSYLSRAFKAQTGHSPLDYLHLRRLARAKTLLRETNDSVKDIAAAVGYADSNALLRQMRKYEGITPGQYRASTLE